MKFRCLNAIEGDTAGRCAAGRHWLDSTLSRTLSWWWRCRRMFVRPPPARHLPRIAFFPPIKRMVSRGSLCMAKWRADGKELIFIGADGSVSGGDSGRKHRAAGIHCGNELGRLGSNTDCLFSRDLIGLSQRSKRRKRPSGPAARPGASRIQPSHRGVPPLPITAGQFL